MQYSELRLNSVVEFNAYFHLGKHGKCQKKNCVQSPIGSKRQSSTRSKEDTVYEFKKDEVH